MFRFLFPFLFFCISFSYAVCVKNGSSNDARNAMDYFRRYDPLCQPPNVCECNVLIFGEQTAYTCWSCAIRDGCRNHHSLLEQDCCIGSLKVRPISQFVCHTMLPAFTRETMEANFFYVDELLGYSEACDLNSYPYDCNQLCTTFPDGTCFEECMLTDTCGDDPSSSSGGGSSSSGGESGSSSSGGSSSSSGSDASSSSFEGGDSSSSAVGSSGSGGGSSGSGGGGGSSGSGLDWCDIYPDSPLCECYNSSDCGGSSDSGGVGEIPICNSPPNYTGTCPSILSSSGIPPPFFELDSSLCTADFFRSKFRSGYSLNVQYNADESVCSLCYLPCLSLPDPDPPLESRHGPIKICHPTRSSLPCSYFSSTISATTYFVGDLSPGDYGTKVPFSWIGSSAIGSYCISRSRSLVEDNPCYNVFFNYGTDADGGYCTFCYYPCTGGGKCVSSSSSAVSSSSALASSSSAAFSSNSVGSSASGGGSSGSGGGGNSSASGGDGGGGSSGSGGDGGGPGGPGGGSSGSGGGYWCDHHPDDPVCADAGYDDWCEAHPADPFCEWSVQCSQNPSDPLCVNPQPPPGGPGVDPGSGGSASSGDSLGGPSCKDLKNCDWSTLETQLVQLGVEKEVRDSIRSVIDWLRRKSHEDSLLALMRWNSESDDRRRHLEVSETLNGRIFAYYAEQSDISSQQLGRLGRMDSMAGLYYASSLSGLDANRKSLDTLRGKLLQAFGDGSDDIVGAIERLSGTVAANSHGPVNLSGVVGGISGVSEGISGLGEGIGRTNSLLGKLDSSLSAGNSDLLGFLGGSCEGSGCADYDGAFTGVGGDAFGGLDTSGLSSVRYDSLLSVSGSGGLQDTAHAWGARLRAATATPFSDNVACPAEELSIDACGYFGKECRVSLCDDMFHVRGRHFFEWVGVFFEFVAWVLFFVRIA